MASRGAYLILRGPIEGEAMPVLHEYIRRELRIDGELSRQKLRALFKENKITVDLKPLRKDQKIVLNSKEELSVSFAVQSLSNYFFPKATPASSADNLEILFEDDLLLAINKPSGMPSVPLNSEETHTAVNLVLAYRPEIAHIGNNPLEPGALHRLDSETSGVLLFTKTQAAFDQLKMDWKTEKIRKIYRALVTGDKNKILAIVGTTINLPLSPNPKNKKKMICEKLERRKSKYGQEARTQIISANKTKKKHLFDLEIEILTGVRHQIRCHLATMSAPVLGDELYGGEKSERLQLHAWKLIVDDQVIEAPLPQSWTKK